MRKNKRTMAVFAVAVAAALLTPAAAYAGAFGAPDATSNYDFGSRRWTSHHALQYGYGNTSAHLYGYSKSWVWSGGTWVASPIDYMTVAVRIIENGYSHPAGSYAGYGVSVVRAQTADLAFHQGTQYQLNSSHNFRQGTTNYSKWLPQTFNF